MTVPVAIPSAPLVAVDESVTLLFRAPYCGFPTDPSIPGLPKMTRRARCFTTLALSAAIGAGAASSVGAQEGATHPVTQVISANPFGIMLEFFNAEYEHVAGESFTTGVGGSYFTSDDLTYFNLDGFWRFYPQEETAPFNGWAFGLKAGLTNVDDRTYFGAGFDVNRSWLLGKNDNFYVGVGFGLKRLMGHGTGLQFIPTIRLINVGYAF